MITFDGGSRANTQTVLHPQFLSTETLYLTYNTARNAR